jgi:hypothetical protein
MTGRETRELGFLLHWLEADDGQWGECRGAAAELAMKDGLIEWKDPPHPRGDDHRRVGLTEQGRAAAASMPKRL